MRRHIVGLLTATVLASIAAPNVAAAQSTPAFRVPIGGSSTTSSTPPVYAWMESVSACSSTCGSGTRTTNYQCQNASDFDYSGGGYGAPEADGLCVAAAGPKPASSTSSCSNYSACNYDWVKPAVGMTPQAKAPDSAGRVGCGWVHETFSPYCQRMGSGAPVVLPKGDYQFCRNDRPDYDGVASGDPDALGYDRVAKQLSACAPVDHQWVEGPWGAWSSTCSATATRTHTISCKRTFDSTIVADSQCDPATKPSASASETGANYSSCDYAWSGATEAAWGAWSSTCSNNATRTRSVTCTRSDGSTATDQQCVDAGKGAKPATSQTQGIYTGCRYWPGNAIAYDDFNSYCSANATRLIHYNCQRSDGVIVDDQNCYDAGFGLTRVDGPYPIYFNCDYHYQADSWGSWSSGCSANATRTRSVNCVRDDNSYAPDSQCTSRGLSKPDSSETQANYGSCGYGAGGTPTYGAWDSTCSANAQRNVHYQCVRSDNTVVGDAECANRGTSLDRAETAANYSSCNYAYATGNWSDWNSHCSNSATRTRSVQCQSNGNAVSDSSCANTGQARPASSETQAVFDGCSYSFATGNWSDWNSHCSGSATRTRSVQCQQSNGTAVDDSSCTNSGQARPASSETQGVFDGCGYSFVTGNWSDWNSHCSGSATHTRSVQCQSSNGSAASDNDCTSRGQSRPASSETTGVYDGCGYYYSVDPWSDWSSHCSSNASHRRNVYCRRSDGAYIDGSVCQGKGVQYPTDYETAGVYDGCGYNAVTGSFSSCQPNGTQSRNVQCQRSDGAYVDVGNCGLPAGSSNYTQQQSCTYSTPSSGNFCENGSAVYSHPFGQGGGEITLQQCQASGGNCVQADDTVTYDQYGYERDHDNQWICFKDSTGTTSRSNGTCSSYMNGNAGVMCNSNAQFQNPAGDGEGACTGGSQTGSWTSADSNGTSNVTYDASMASRGWNRNWNNVNFPSWCRSQGGTCWDEHETLDVNDNRAGDRTHRYDMRCFTGSTSHVSGLSNDQEDQFTTHNSDWAWHRIQ